MIRVELREMWVEFKLNSARSVVCRNKHSSHWGLSEYKTLEDAEKDFLSGGWNVTRAGIDPNDLQVCPHVYNLTTNTCKLCGEDWDRLFNSWQGAFTKPCCGGGITPGMGAAYNKGAWHDNNCDTLKAPTAIPVYEATTPNYRPEGSKKGICTCGSAKLGSDRHSSWCDSL